MATKYKFVGDKEMTATLRRIAKNNPKRFTKALNFRAEKVMTRSKKDFVPVRDANLRDTGVVVVTTKRPDRPEVTLAYGGPGVPYALAVHEHLSKHSPPSWQVAEKQGGGVTFHPSGRGPKFLEKPLMEARRTLARDLAKDLRVEKWRDARA